MRDDEDHLGNGVRYATSLGHWRTPERGIFRSQISSFLNYPYIDFHRIPFTF